MFIQLAGSRRSWQKPGGAIISLVMILSMLILSFILYFEFRISGRYLLSEESGYLFLFLARRILMKQTKNLVTSGMCVALAIVLPMAFHMIPDAGQVFLPMHSPVLLCGLLCGPVYGLGCGILAPLLSHLFTGMPPTAMLPSMLCELAAYGMLSGILIRVIRTKWNLLNLYTALIGAMICGRIINGVLNALIFNAGKYSMEMWLTASFLQAIPGIVIQLALIPLLVLALQKARLADRAGTARV